MPIQVSEAKTKAGNRLMRCVVSGHVSLADAEAMGNQLKAGQAFHKCLVLCVVEKSTDYSPESRKHFGTMQGNYQAMGTVVSSASRSAGWRSTNLVFQKGCDNHEPSMDWRYMPS